MQNFKTIINRNQIPNATANHSIGDLLDMTFPEINRYYSYINSSYRKWNTDSDEDTKVARNVMDKLVTSTQIIYNFPLGTLPFLHDRIYGREYSCSFSWDREPLSFLLKILGVGEDFLATERDKNTFVDMYDFSEFMSDLAILWKTTYTRYSGNELRAGNANLVFDLNKIAPAREALAEYESEYGEIYNDWMREEDYLLIQKRLAHDISLDVALDALMDGIPMEDIVA